MALQPTHLAKAIVGMKQLAKNGLRYPIAPYGIQNDVRAGMGVSYASRNKKCVIGADRNLGFRGSRRTPRMTDDQEE